MAAVAAALSALVASGVSAVFAVRLFQRHRRRGRTPATFYWGVSLAMFSLASVMLLIGVLAGWASWSFRLFYLFGAILNVPWLALGNIAINARRRVPSLVTGAVALVVALLSVRGGLGAEPLLWWPSVALAGAWGVALVTARGAAMTRLAAAATILGSIAAAVAVLTVELQTTLATSGLPEGRELFPLGVRGIAVAGNAVGATVVVVSALASSAHIVWRRPQPEEAAVFRTIGRDRTYADALSRWVFSGRRGARGVGNVVRGNLLIAGGVGLAAAGGLLSFLGDTTGHAVALAIGVVVMYRGFVRTTQPEPAREEGSGRPATVTHTSKTGGGGTQEGSLSTQARAGRRPRPVVEVYGREGCHLCQEAERLVAREARRAEVRHVDIDDDDALLARYQIRIPVVTVDGREVAEGRIVAGEIRRALRGRRRRLRTGEPSA